MKALAIMALVFGIGAAGSVGYAMVETKGNYDSTTEEIKKTAGKSPKLIQVEQASWDDYHKTMGRLVAGAFAGGALALILGGIAAAKEKRVRTLAIVGIVIGLGAIGAALSIMPQPLVV